MDVLATLTAYSFPLCLLVVLLATWAAVRGLILAHHFNAITGTLFAGASYLTATRGSWVAAVLYGVIAYLDFRRCARLRPRPLDGSHEAL